MSPTASFSSLKPSLPPGVHELYFPIHTQSSSAGRLIYHPAVGVFAQVAIFDNRLGISQVANVGNYLELSEDVIGLLWEKSIPVSIKVEELEREPKAGVSFLALPARFLSMLKSAENDYLDYLARTYQLNLWKSNVFQANSQPGESERDFRIRLSLLAREKRDEALERLRQKYAPKIASLEKQYLTAQQRLQREQEEYKETVALSAISMGATIFGAILGRKSYQVGRATTTARSASRAYYEKLDIRRAQEQVELARARLEEMERELEREAENITRIYNPEREELQTMYIRPKKKDIAVRWLGLLWLPFWHLDSGGVEPASRLR